MGYNDTGGSNLWATDPMLAKRAVEHLGHGQIIHDICAMRETTLSGSYWGPDNDDPNLQDAFYTVGDDGQIVERGSWMADHTAWMNPPYSRQCLECPCGVWTPKNDEGTGCAARGHKSSTIKDWMEKIKASVGCEVRKAGSIIALPPARTDGWWHSCVIGVASRVLFVEGRLHFHQPNENGVLVPSKNSSPVPSVIVEYIQPPPGRRWVTQMGTISKCGSKASVPPLFWMPAQ